MGCSVQAVAEHERSDTVHASHAAPRVSGRLAMLTRAPAFRRAEPCTAPSMLSPPFSHVGARGNARVLAHHCIMQAVPGPWRCRPQHDDGVPAVCWGWPVGSCASFR